jgi:hypothetical protein
MRGAMVTCRVCDGPAEPAFEATILGRHRVRYFHCAACGYLQTEEPSWLSEAYAEAINLQDTGLVSRNLRFAEETALLLFHFFDRRGRFVDFAGGTGLLTRLMRDAGFDFRWHDAYATNVHARGFEASPDERGVELVTCFECLEHLVRPAEELGRMLAMSRSVLVSTELLPSPRPAPGAWPYYGLEHGQHVGFFERRTLEQLAARYGLRLYAWGPLHLLTDRALPALKRRLVRRFRRPLLRRLRRAMPSLTQADHDLLARLPPRSTPR